LDSKYIISNINIFAHSCVFLEIFLYTGEVTASGYRAPTAKPGDYPYFVGRTTNYMPRVHMYNNPLFKL